MLFVGGTGGGRECAVVAVGRIAFPEWGIVTGHADEGGREGTTAQGTQRRGAAGLGGLL